MIETLECWLLALESRETPSLFALSRQAVPQLRTERSPENLCARGAYVLHQARGTRDVTLIATGTEVSLAVQAAGVLSGYGIEAAVVSMPCWELFDAQPASYRLEVLGEGPRIAIEAAGKFGWARYVDSDDDVIGMVGYGASAPAEVLYEKFEITVEAIVRRAESLVARARAGA